MEIDGKLDALTQPTLTGKGESAPNAADERELQATFDAIAREHLRPVRELMANLRFGPAPSAWVPMCVTAVDNVRASAAQLERASLAETLSSFRDVLRERANGGATLDGDARQALLAAFEQLRPLLPDLGADPMTEREQREPIIVEALLQQVTGLEHVGLRRIYAAGLRDLGALVRAAPDEISATSGVDEAVAAGIAEQARRYRDEFGTAVSSPDRDAEMKRLSALVTALAELHDRFSDAAARWSDEAIASRRRLRRERERVVSQIRIVLARIGALNDLEELERRPVHRKLELLKRLLGVTPSSRAS